MRSDIARSSRAVFVDSGAFYALSDPTDASHPEARTIATRLAAERWRSFTTNFVVAETHALVLARRGRAAAARVLAEIDTVSARVIVRAEEEDERRARAIIRQYADKDFSLTDAISFAVMERLGIGHAFAFDRHFAQYGFTVLVAGAPA